MVDTPDVVAEVQSMTSHPEGTEVQVEVQGPKGTPDFFRSLRARGRALIASGVAPSTVDTVEELPSGNIQRLTKEEGTPIREHRSRITEATLHTIIVNRD